MIVRNIILEIIWLGLGSYCERKRIWFCVSHHISSFKYVAAVSYYESLTFHSEAELS